MIARGSGNAQQAVDFLLKLDAGGSDWSSLPASVDYGAILRVARLSGFETDEPALKEAFALIMRARLLASLQDRVGDTRS